MANSEKKRAKWIAFLNSRFTKDGFSPSKDHRARQVAEKTHGKVQENDDERRNVVFGNSVESVCKIDFDHGQVFVCSAPFFKLVKVATLSRRQISPIAIGRTPPFYFFNAIKGVDDTKEGKSSGKKAARYKFPSEVKAAMHESARQPTERARC
jgi:hypothetical protein